MEASELHKLHHMPHCKIWDTCRTGCDIIYFCQLNFTFCLFLLVTCTSTHVLLFKSIRLRFNACMLFIFKFVFRTIKVSFMVYSYLVSLCNLNFLLFHFSLSLFILSIALGLIFMYNSKYSRYT